MTGSCSVCLYIDSPFALLGMVHIRPFELQIFRYSVFMLSCSIKMWKHVAFLSIPNSCLNLTLFIHRPYVFPPVRICFLHPTLTMRKQPTSFPWCAPHFFLGWMIPWINKTLEGHRDLGQVELLDPKWLNTQFTRPVATHFFFVWNFHLEKTMGVSWFPIWRSHMFHGWVGIQPWTGKPLIPGDPSLNCCHWNAGGGPSSWSWSMLGLTSDFLCGKGRASRNANDTPRFAGFVSRFISFLFLGSVL